MVGMCEREFESRPRRGIRRGQMKALPIESSDRDALIEEYQEFVEGLVSRFIRVMGLPQRHREDFIAAGFLGLVEAAGRFDAARGSDFRAYAYLRIRGAVIDHVRAACDLSGYAYRMLKALEAAQEIREQSLQDEVATPQTERSKPRRGMDVLTKSAVAFTLAHSAGDCPFFGGKNPTDPERELHKKQVSQKIRSILATLPEKERIIVEQYYFRDLTLGEVAEQYAGLSKSWVSRLHDRALEILRDKLVEEGVSL